MVGFQGSQGHPKQDLTLIVQKVQLDLGINHTNLMLFSSCIGGYITSIPGLDVYKIVRCVEHKRVLDAVPLKLKNNIIDSNSECDFLDDIIIFNKDKRNGLTLKLLIYELGLISREILLVTDEAPILKFATIDPAGGNNNELTDLFLSKGGFICVREYKSGPHYEYGDTSLFLHILDATLGELKSASKIPY